MHELSALFDVLHDGGDGECQLRSGVIGGGLFPLLFLLLVLFK